MQHAIRMCCRETWRLWVYCVVLIGYIIIFNIGFNLLLTFLGRACFALLVTSACHVDQRSVSDSLDAVTVSWWRTMVKVTEGIRGICAAISGGQAVLTEDALAEKEAAAKGGEGAAALASASTKGDRAGSRSRRAIEPVDADQVPFLSSLPCRCRSAMHSTDFVSKH